MMTLSKSLITLSLLLLLRALSIGWIQMLRTRSLVWRWKAALLYAMRPIPVDLSHKYLQTFSKPEQELLHFYLMDLSGTEIPHFKPYFALHFYMMGLSGTEIPYF